MSTKNTTKYVLKDFSERFNQIIGYRSKDDRDARNIAANKLGVNYENVRSWSQGTRVPGADAILNIKETYNIDVNWLLTGKDPETTPQPVNPPVISDAAAEYHVHDREDTLISNMSKLIDQLARRDAQIELMQEELRKLREEVKEMKENLIKPGDQGTGGHWVAGAA